MNIAEIKVNGQTFYNVPVDGLEELGVDEGTRVKLVRELELKEKRAALVNKIRHDIELEAGDTQSLLGTTSDAVQMLLYAFCVLVKGLQDSNSVDEVNQSMQAFQPMAGQFLSGLESGDIKLPFQAKGLESVIADIVNRSGSVYDVLSRNSSSV